MGVELVHHQHQLLRLLVAPLQQRTKEQSPVPSAAVVRHREMAPAREGFAGQEQARNPVAGVDVVIALDRPGRIGRGSLVSPTSCLKVSSTHTTGRLGSYGRW